jgi:hypothetical protein
MLGEVCTGLLQHSTSVPRTVSDTILALRPGEAVRWSTRPIAYAVSPTLLTGVDCRLPAHAEKATRSVGTLMSRATLTGGHVLQGSAFGRVLIGDARRRLPWSYYLSRPGILETIGKVSWLDVVAGFTGPKQPANGLDLGAIAGRVMDLVQDSPELDRRAPFAVRRTRLRWAVLPWAGGLEGGSGPQPAVQFGIDGDTVRSLVLCLDPGALAETLPNIVELCEDIALHDWLLTTLLALIERSRIGAGPAAHVVDRLKPAVDHLLHLWMPAARVDRSLEEVWQILERRPGFSRQWQASVDRVRDQLSVNAIALLSSVGHRTSRT